MAKKLKAKKVFIVDDQTVVLDRTRQRRRQRAAEGQRRRSSVSRSARRRPTSRPS